jgi:hypothetical protein
MYRRYADVVPLSPSTMAAQRPLAGYVVTELVGLVDADGALSSVGLVGGSPHAADNSSAKVVA